MRGAAKVRDEPVNPQKAKIADIAEATEALKET